MQEQDELLTLKDESKFVNPWKANTIGIKCISYKPKRYLTLTRCILDVYTTNGFDSEIEIVKIYAKRYTTTHTIPSIGTSPLDFEISDTISIDIDGPFTCIIDLVLDVQIMAMGPSKERKNHQRIRKRSLVVNDEKKHDFFYRIRNEMRLMEYQSLVRNCFRQQSKKQKSSNDYNYVYNPQSMLFSSQQNLYINYSSTLANEQMNLQRNRVKSEDVDAKRLENNIDNTSTLFNSESFNGYYSSDLAKTPHEMIIQGNDSKSLDSYDWNDEKNEKSKFNRVGENKLYTQSCDHETQITCDILKNEESSSNESFTKSEVFDSDSHDTANGQEYVDINAYKVENKTVEPQDQLNIKNTSSSVPLNLKISRDNKEFLTNQESNDGVVGFYFSTLKSIENLIHTEEQEKCLNESVEEDEYVAMSGISPSSSNDSVITVIDANIERNVSQVESLSGSFDRDIIVVNELSIENENEDECVATVNQNCMEKLTIIDSIDYPFDTIPASYDTFSDLADMRNESLDKTVDSLVFELDENKRMRYLGSYQIETTEENTDDKILIENLKIDAEVENILKVIPFVEKATSEIHKNEDSIVEKVNLSDPLSGEAISNFNEKDEMHLEEILSLNSFIKTSNSNRNLQIESENIERIVETNLTESYSISTHDQNSSESQKPFKNENELHDKLFENKNINHENFTEKIEEKLEVFDDKDRFSGNGDANKPMNSSEKNKESQLSLIVSNRVTNEQVETLISSRASLKATESVITQNDSMEPIECVDGLEISNESNCDQTVLLSNNECASIFDKQKLQQGLPILLPKDSTSSEEIFERQLLTGINSTRLNELLPIPNDMCSESENGFKDGFECTEELNKSDIVINDSSSQDGIKVDRVSNVIDNSKSTRINNESEETKYVHLAELENRLSSSYHDTYGENESMGHQSIEEVCLINNGEEVKLNEQKDTTCLEAENCADLDSLGTSKLIEEDINVIDFAKEIKQDELDYSHEKFKTKIGKLIDSNHHEKLKQVGEISVNELEKNVITIANVSESDYILNDNINLSRRELLFNISDISVDPAELKLQANSQEALPILLTSDTAHSISESIEECKHVDLIHLDGNTNSLHNYVEYMRSETEKHNDDAHVTKKDDECVYSSLGFQMNEIREGHYDVRIEKLEDASGKASNPFLESSKSNNVCSFLIKNEIEQMEVSFKSGTNSLRENAFINIENESITVKSPMPDDPSTESSSDDLNEENTINATSENNDIIDQADILISFTEVDKMGDSKDTENDKCKSKPTEVITDLPYLIREVSIEPKQEEYSKFNSQAINSDNALNGAHECIIDETHTDRNKHDNESMISLLERVCFDDPLNEELDEINEIRKDIQHNNMPLNDTNTESVFYVFSESKDRKSLDTNSIFNERKIKEIHDRVSENSHSYIEEIASETEFNTNSNPSDYITCHKPVTDSASDVVSLRQAVELRFDEPISNKKTADSNETPTRPLSQHEFTSNILDQDMSLPLTYNYQEDHSFQVDKINHSIKEITDRNNLNQGTDETECIPHENTALNTPLREDRCILEDKIALTESLTTKEDEDLTNLNKELKIDEVLAKLDINSKEIFPSHESINQKEIDVNLKFDYDTLFTQGTLILENLVEENQDDTGFEGNDHENSRTEESMILIETTALRTSIEEATSAFDSAFQKDDDTKNVYVGDINYFESRKSNPNEVLIITAEASFDNVDLKILGKDLIKKNSLCLREKDGYNQTETKLSVVHHEKEHAEGLKETQQQIEDKILLDPINVDTYHTESHSSEIIHNNLNNSLQEAISSFAEVQRDDLNHQENIIFDINENGTSIYSMDKLDPEIFNHKSNRILVFESDELDNEIISNKVRDSIDGIVINQAIVEVVSPEVNMKADIEFGEKLNNKSDNEITHNEVKVIEPDTKYREISLSDSKLDTVRPKEDLSVNKNEYSIDNYDHDLIKNHFSYLVSDETSSELVENFLGHISSTESNLIKETINFSNQISNNLMDLLHQRAPVVINTLNVESSHYDSLDNGRSILNDNTSLNQSDALTMKDETIDTKGLKREVISQKEFKVVGSCHDVLDDIKNMQFILEEPHGNESQNILKIRLDSKDYEIPSNISLTKQEIDEAIEEERCIDNLNDNDIEMNCSEQNFSQLKESHNESNTVIESQLSDHQNITEIASTHQESPRFDVNFSSPRSVASSNILSSEETSSDFESYAAKFSRESPRTSNREKYFELVKEHEQREYELNNEDEILLENKNTEDINIESNFDPHFTRAYLDLVFIKDLDNNAMDSSNEVQCSSIETITLENQTRESYRDEDEDQELFDEKHQADDLNSESGFSDDRHLGYTTYSDHSCLSRNSLLDDEFNQTSSIGTISHENCSFVNELFDKQLYEQFVGSSMYIGTDSLESITFNQPPQPPSFSISYSEDNYEKEDNLTQMSLPLVSYSNQQEELSVESNLTISKKKRNKKSTITSPKLETIHSYDELLPLERSENELRCNLDESCHVFYEDLLRPNEILADFCIYKTEQERVENNSLAMKEPLGLDDCIQFDKYTAWDEYISTQYFQNQKFASCETIFDPYNDVITKQSPLSLVHDLIKFTKVDTEVIETDDIIIENVDEHLYSDLLKTKMAIHDFFPYKYKVTKESEMSQPVREMFGIENCAQFDKTKDWNNLYTTNYNLNLKSSKNAAEFNAYDCQIEPGLYMANVNTLKFEYEVPKSDKNNARIFPNTDFLKIERVNNTRESVADDVIDFDKDKTLGLNKDSFKNTTHNQKELDVCQFDQYSLWDNKYSMHYFDNLEQDPFNESIETKYDKKPDLFKVPFDYNQDKSQINDTLLTKLKQITEIQVESKILPTLTKRNISRVTDTNVSFNELVKQNDNSLDFSPFILNDNFVKTNEVYEEIQLCDEHPCQFDRYQPWNNYITTNYTNSLQRSKSVLDFDPYMISSEKNDNKYVKPEDNFELAAKVKGKRQTLLQCLSTLFEVDEREEQCDQASPYETGIFDRSTTKLEITNEAATYSELVLPRSNCAEFGLYKFNSNYVSINKMCDIVPVVCMLDDSDVCVFNKYTEWDKNYTQDYGKSLQKFNQNNKVNIETKSLDRDDKVAEKIPQQKSKKSYVKLFFESIKPQHRFENETLINKHVYAKDDCGHFDKYSEWNNSYTSDYSSSNKESQNEALFDSYQTNPVFEVYVKPIDTFEFNPKTSESQQVKKKRGLFSILNLLRSQALEHISENGTHEQTDTYSYIASKVNDCADFSTYHYKIEPDVSVKEVKMELTEDCGQFDKYSEWDKNYTSDYLANLKTSQDNGQFNAYECDKVEINVKEDTSEPTVSFYQSDLDQSKDSIDFSKLKSEWDSGFSSTYVDSMKTSMSESTYVQQVSIELPPKDFELSEVVVIENNDKNIEKKNCEVFEIGLFDKYKSKLVIDDDNLKYSDLVQTSIDCAHFPLYKFNFENIRVLSENLKENRVYLSGNDCCVFDIHSEWDSTYTTDYLKVAKNLTNAEEFDPYANVEACTHEESKCEPGENVSQAIDEVKNEEIQVEEKEILNTDAIETGLFNQMFNRLVLDKEDALYFDLLKQNSNDAEFQLYKLNDKLVKIFSINTKVLSKFYDVSDCPCIFNRYLDNLTGFTAHSRSFYSSTRLPLNKVCLNDDFAQFYDTESCHMSEYDVHKRYGLMDRLAELDASSYKIQSLSNLIGGTLLISFGASLVLLFSLFY